MYLRIGATGSSTVALTASASGASSESLTGISVTGGSVVELDSSLLSVLAVAFSS